MQRLYTDFRTDAKFRVSTDFPITELHLNLLKRLVPADSEFPQHE